MNSVSLIGRLTADPELRHTQSGTANTRFTIAVDRNYQKSGEEKQTDFISITAWQQTAEFICRYFVKGQRIALTGRIQTGNYTDKDGNKRYTFDVVAEKVEFCESKKQNSDTIEPTYENHKSEKVNKEQTESEGEIYKTNDEDLPF